MKVSHNNEADPGDDETPELNTTIRSNTASEIFGDLSVKEDDGAAASKNNKSHKDPTDRKIPIHMYIIPQF